jgi:transposase-like protein
MTAMTKHRSHSAAFKRQVAQEFVAGETLHGLSKRHDISRQLIRIWVGKYEAGALDDDVQAAGVRLSSRSVSLAQSRSRSIDHSFTVLVQGARSVQGKE